MKYSIIEIQQALTDADEALILLKEAHKDFYTESIKVMFLHFWLQIILYSTPCMNGRATICGVFKSICVLFRITFGMSDHPVLQVRFYSLL